MSDAIILCDIDGVLADCSHRLHYKESKNYDAFYGTAILEDQRIATGGQLVKSILEMAQLPLLCFITGRPERTRTMTEMWLHHHFEYLYGFCSVRMREDGDYRPAPIIKTELVKYFWEEHRIKPDRVVYFIDDDPENVKAVCEAFPQTTGITFGVGRMK